MGVVKLKNELNSNDQFDVAGYLRKEYDFVQVRSTFNTLEAVFDEDTQKGVDRVMRGILQDLTEAEAAAKFNEEGVRTPKKLLSTKNKLEKLDGQFKKLFEYLIAKAE